MEQGTAFRAARDELLALRGQHDRAVESFRWPELGARFNWGTDWFDSFASGSDRPGLVVVQTDGSAERRTFAELSARSNRLARWLAGQGVARGDPVLVMLGNQIELWESMLALVKLGAVIVPTTTALGPGDLSDRIDRSGARHVIAAGSDLAKFAEVPGDYGRLRVGPGPAGWLGLDEAHGTAGDRGSGGDDAPLDHPGTSPGDPLLYYFTSGTTSRPKLVEHSQVSYPLGHLTTMFWLGLRPGDVHMNISSPGWAKHAWSCFFAPWNAEATVVVFNYARFDAAALLEQLQREAVTSFCAPPTVWRMLIQADLSGGPWDLREVVAAGEPLNPEVIDQVHRAWGLTIRDGYGQTETTASIGNVPGAPLKAGSMGRPLPGCPVRLVDPVSGSVSREGEICLDLSLRPLTLMSGYRDDPDRNAEALSGGYYHTGDVASLDDDGYITYVGRTDDVFKASDYKISPFELESVLIEHPAVMEAAVVPAPDPIRLAVPKAYVALAPGHEATSATALSILRHARDKLAPFQRVRRIEFAELPKTISGKIRRVELRDREESRPPGSPAATEWRDDQFPELRPPPGGSGG